MGKLHNTNQIYSLMSEDCYSKHVMDSGQKISCSCHPQVLEIYNTSRSPQQVRTSREYPYILFNKTTTLLEGYEQRYPKVHCKLHPLLQRESQDSELLA